MKICNDVYVEGDAIVISLENIEVSHIEIVN